MVGRKRSIRQIRSGTNALDAIARTTKGEVMTEIIPEITVAEAVQVLCDALETDDGLFWAYQSNIAMQFVDHVERAGKGFPELHQLANDAAKEFLRLLMFRPEEEE
jgi:hypothetical protein